jgi:glyoxylase-like metal-dependent hydrolase (beta-lactamase superfamily II)
MAANDESAIEVPKAKYDYPFGETSLEYGKPMEVADGVFWLTLPLPFSLTTINIWLLRDGDGWIIVDTGVRGKNVRLMWEDVFENFLKGAPIHKVIVTHYHPDHIGQAGWMTRRFDVSLSMSRADFLLCRTLILDKWETPPPEAVQFYHRAGFNQKQ